VKKLTKAQEIQAMRFAWGAGDGDVTEETEDKVASNWSKPRAVKSSDKPSVRKGDWK